MSGSATFSGTTYQANVIAYAYAHTLAQSGLNWIGLSDDLPIAVWGETGSGGDDARIDLGEGRGSIEVQAKHGLSGGAELDKVFDRILANPASGNSPIALVVDYGSSRKIFTAFARDLDRLRGGRSDGLSAETIRVREKLGASASLLERVFVCALDLDRPSDAGTKHAVLLLESVLEDRSQAGAAWSVLVDDAGGLCAKQLRRTRKEIVDLLTSKKMKVLPAPKDEKWHRRLELTRRLLLRGLNAAAAAELKLIESEVGHTQIEPHTRYRILQQRSAAEIRLGHHRPALDFAVRALDTDPAGLEAMLIAATAAVALGDLKRAEAISETATTTHVHDGRAWGLATYVAEVKGSAWPTPPSSVAESAFYLLNAATLLASKGDLNAAIVILEKLYERGDRSPDLLYCLSNSLLQLSFESEATTRARAEKAERIATELIDDDRAHVLIVKALVVRSGARRMLNRLSEATDDLAEARALSSGDPDAIRHSAQVRLEAGDAVGAVDILRHPEVESEPSLVALRARALGASGDKVRAASDLITAVKLLESAEPPAPETVWVYIIEAAVSLKDLATAERLVQSAPRSGHDNEYWSVLEGRMAFLRNDVSAGISAFRKALEFKGKRRDAWLEELATRLLHKKQPGEAVKVFQELGLTKLAEPGLREYAAALMQSNNLSGSQEVIDHLRSSLPIPTWGVQLAAHLALLQENSDAAIGHLTELVARGQPTVGTRLDLVRALLDADRYVEAIQQIDILLERPEGLQAVERSLVA